MKISLKCLDFLTVLNFWSKTCLAFSSLSPPISSFQSSPTYPKAPPVFPSPSLLYRTMASLPRPAQSQSLKSTLQQDLFLFHLFPFIKWTRRLCCKSLLIFVLLSLLPYTKKWMLHIDIDLAGPTLPALSLPSQLIASVPRLLHFEQSVSLSLTPAVAFSNFYMNRPWKFLFVSRK